MPRRRLSARDLDRRAKFAAELVAFRRARGLTQHELSKALGINRYSLKSLEDQTTTLPKISVLKRFEELKRQPRQRQTA